MAILPHEVLMDSIRAGFIMWLSSGMVLAYEHRIWPGLLVSLVACAVVATALNLLAWRLAVYVRARGGSR